MHSSGTRLGPPLGTGKAFLDAPGNESSYHRTGQGMRPTIGHLMNAFHAARDDDSIRAGACRQGRFLSNTSDLVFDQCAGLALSDDLNRSYQRRPGQGRVGHEDNINRAVVMSAI